MTCRFTCYFDQRQAMLFNQLKWTLFHSFAKRIRKEQRDRERSKEVKQPNSNVINAQQLAWLERYNATSRWKYSSAARVNKREMRSYNYELCKIVENWIRVIEKMTDHVQHCSSLSSNHIWVKSRLIVAGKIGAWYFCRRLPPYKTQKQKIILWKTKHKPKKTIAFRSSWLLMNLRSFKYGVSHTMKS